LQWVPPFVPTFELFQSTDSKRELVLKRPLNSMGGFTLVKRTVVLEVADGGGVWSTTVKAARASRKRAAGRRRFYEERFSERIRSLER